MSILMIKNDIYTKKIQFCVTRNVLMKCPSSATVNASAYGAEDSGFVRTRIQNEIGTKTF